MYLNDNHMVAILQEMRATPAEMELLGACLLGTALHGTCGAGHAEGGLITMVTRRFTSEFPSRELAAIISDRASMLRCTIAAGSRLDLLNLHLIPHAQDSPAGPSEVALGDCLCGRRQLRGRRRGPAEH